MWGHQTSPTRRARHSAPIATGNQTSFVVGPRRAAPTEAAAEFKRNFRRYPLVFCLFLPSRETRLSPPRRAPVANNRASAAVVIAFKQAAVLRRRPPSVPPLRRCGQSDETAGKEPAGPGPFLPPKFSLAGRLATGAFVSNQSSHQPAAGETVLGRRAAPRPFRSARPARAAPIHVPTLSCDAATNPRPGTRRSQRRGGRKCVSSAVKRS